MMDLMRRALRKGYCLSIDNGSELVVWKSRSLQELGYAKVLDAYLMWVYDKKEEKIGWVKVRTRGEEVIDYSRRDFRLDDLVTEEFVGSELLEAARRRRRR